jgi:uncharacterized circularly permuted ATP-grasp superfamily protein
MQRLNPDFHSFGEIAYHEFNRDNFEPRDHYRPLWELIRKAGQNLLATKAREAHLALHTEGVTFTVYSDKEQGIERVWPFDLIPRIIPAGEWQQIEAGLKQRVKALNLFLKDVMRQALHTDVFGHPINDLFVGEDIDV